jgi:predicted RNase H-like nuclease (RuvC/YqgF family)
MSAISNSANATAALAASVVTIVGFTFKYFSDENERTRIKMERDKEQQKLVNDKLEKRVEEAGKKANEAMSKCDEIKISRLEEKMEMRERLDMMKRENDALGSEIRELKSNNRRLEDQLQTLRSELMREIEEIKTKFSLEQQRSENQMSVGFARMGMVSDDFMGLVPKNRGRRGLEGSNSTLRKLLLEQEREENDPEGSEVNN